MSLRTVEVEIDHGQVKTPSHERLPETGRGLLTILPAVAPFVIVTGKDGLPVIRAEGRITSEQVREIEALVP